MTLFPVVLWFSWTIHGLALESSSHIDWLPDWQTLTDWLNGIENNKDDWKSLTEDCKSLVVDCKSLTDDCQSLTDNCKSLTDDCKSLPDWLKNTS